MVSDLCAAYALRVASGPDWDGRWIVGPTALFGSRVWREVYTRRQAVSALTLAELTVRGLVDDPGYRLLVGLCRADLGLAG